MAQNSSNWKSFQPGSLPELLAALAPFVFLGAFMTLLSYLGLFNYLPGWLAAVTALLFLGLLLGLVGLGFYQRLPRWFLVYLGVPLPLIYLQTNLSTQGVPSMPSSGFQVKSCA